MREDFLVVIPARMGSTRFPGKVLAPLRGRPVVDWCRRAAEAAGIGPVLIATDGPAVADALSGSGAHIVMTSTACASGTDRVWEAARLYPGRAPRFIMNLQGDEPLIRASTLRRVAETLRSSPAADMATAVVPLEDEALAADPNAVKAVLAADGRCLYFSRAPVPCDRQRPGRGPFFRHIGVYAYTRRALKRFVSLPPSPLERRECLEQLRALEAGMSVFAAVVQDAAVAIDTPADLERAEGAGAPRRGVRLDLRSRSRSARHASRRKHG